MKDDTVPQTVLLPGVFETPLFKGQCDSWCYLAWLALLTAACVLLQELRLRAAYTAWARTRVSGLHARLLKLCAGTRQTAATWQIGADPLAK